MGPRLTSPQRITNENLYLANGGADSIAHYWITIEKTIGNVLASLD